MDSDTIVRRSDETRKREFRAALALKGLTMREWGRQHGVAQTHLSKMVRGVYTTELTTGQSAWADRVVAQVEQFSDEVLTEFAVTLLDRGQAA